MASFSQFLASRQSQIAALASIPRPLRPVEEILRTAGERKGLDAEDAASLFAAAQNEDIREEIQRSANRVRDLHARKAVEFVIPVYLTSYCQNECLYCGYRQSNPVAERVRLGPEEFERQLDLILSWGHRQIELVLSDDPEFGPDRVARYVALTRRKLEHVGGGVVALCSPVYQQDDYVRLREAGLDWVVEWQETYHRTHFDRWHFPGSPKRNYESRLDLWDTTVAAGLSEIGLGVLLGLYDFRYDALAAIEHGNYLRRTYGIEPHALGFPRLKPARGVLASQKPNRFTVSDEDFRLIISVYRLAFPNSRLFFNTRENYDMNISLVAAGDLFTVDCETLPGAYLGRHLPGQFSTYDYPPRREVVATLERRGLACQYLAEETPYEVPRQAPEAVIDKKQWLDQYALLRAQFNDWETALEGLSRSSSQSGERRAADASLRDILEQFKTALAAHCKQEESQSLAALRRNAGVASRLAALSGDHERFGVDLDKFERQMVSYGLSGDPTVLLALGSRMIREMRGHLDAEEQLWSDVFQNSPASSARAGGQTPR